MFPRVERVERDMADKWRALVSLSETEAQFYKFGHYPSVDEVLETVIRLQENMNELNSATNNNPMVGQ